MFLIADQDYLPSNPTDAKALGLAMYFTGKPCKRNHITTRYASSKDCFFCTQDKNKNKIAKPVTEEQKEKARKRYQANKGFEKLRYQKKWIDNKKAMTARTKDWELRNPEKVKAIGKVKNAMRKQSIKQQRPAWADMEKIKSIYLNCPEGYHVDHIVPLKGKTVCGFHVESNLQYLEARENMRKHNKFGENDGIYN
jgi:hypothetical protein